METENYRLAALLFKDSTQEELLELCQDLEFDKYVKKIGALSVEELVKEPMRLLTEKQQVLERTQELAYRNYKTFVRSAECSRDISARFQTVEQRLESLVGRLPELERRCERFASVASDIERARRLNSLTLTRNVQLLEILEMAQLMETFVREEQYESALELAARVRRLALRHPDVAVFGGTAAEVRRSWAAMARQLLERLRRDIQLPACLEVVGYLRRMQLFTEAELRLRFLQARDAWLKECLASVVVAEDSSTRLAKLVEQTRVCLFAITTQYRAIFNDDETSPSGLQSTDRRPAENAILYAWLHDKVCAFVAVLRRELVSAAGQPTGAPPLDSLLNQCMYFGLSFSRVGCDFRALLAPVFVEAARDSFERSLARATRDFERNMERFTLLDRKATTGSNMGTTRRECLSLTGTDGAGDSSQPPDSLLEFYPLAEYCNRVLTMFNALKLCAPRALARTVTAHLQRSLAVVSNTILQFYGQEQQAFSSHARDAFLRMCVCFTGDLVPYLQKCLHVLFPPGPVAAQLGVSMQTLNRDGLLQLDRTALERPIAHLLPVSITDSSDSDLTHTDNF